jgi:monoamine oxidase
VSLVDVVIVGGGAAGIGAARQLAQYPIDTLLLEAGSRLGGRAWTQKIAGYDVDLGCGWLHSAEHNAWVRIAEEIGVPIDTSRAAWGTQYRDLGFTPLEQAQCHRIFGEWSQRLSESPPRGDRASDALDAAAEWNSYIRAIVGFISGATLEQLSAADYVAYDENSTEKNWRAPDGYGALIARGIPGSVSVRLDTAVEAITLGRDGVRLRTRDGDVRARAVIMTVSTAVLAGGSIELPAALDAWQDAARRLPLGRNEKLILEIVGDAPFEPETHVIGDPRNARTGAYYLRPFGRPLIEAFLGGEGTLVLDEDGSGAAFAFALDQLASLFGSDIRAVLKPLAASAWTQSTRMGGAYSYAVPGHAAARQILAKPFEQRVFFAGEATSKADYSTAHGAHDTGVRAAEEVIKALPPADG